MPPWTTPLPIARLTRREPARGLWPPQIIGEKSGRIYFLDAHEVEYLASAGNYVVAHVGANEFLARATLKGISAQLAPLGFVQIERSLLVNLRQVAHVERRERGQFCFVMRSGARLVSSRERGGEHPRIVAWRDDSARLVAVFLQQNFHARGATQRVTAAMPVRPSHDHFVRAADPLGHKTPWPGFSRPIFRESSWHVYAR